MSFLKSLTRAASNPKRALALVAQQYLDDYRGYSWNFHKNGEYDLLIKMASTQPKIVFDVGANIGHWAMRAQKLFPLSTIHCFEISKVTFAKLKKNTGHAQFVANNIGLADKPGVLEYKDYGKDSGVNTILLDATFHDRTFQPTLLKAEITTGNEYCKAHGIDNIDLLKIDVEGAEHLVLHGFSDLLSRRAIRAIQFEYGYTNGDAKFLMRDFHRFFNGYGYIVGRVKRGPIAFKEWEYKDNNFESGPNFVAVRGDDVALIELLSS